MSSVSNGQYFLTLLLVSVMGVIYRKIRPARYVYIKRDVENVCDARYTLDVSYLSKYIVIYNETLRNQITSCVRFPVSDCYVLVQASRTCNHSSYAYSIP